MYHCIITVVINTHRPIVDESNVHHRLEHAVLHFLRVVLILYLLEEVFVEFSRFLGVCRLVEIRFIAFFQASEEGEL